jgi:hypothetical protein
VLEAELNRSDDLRAMANDPHSAQTESKAQSGVSVDGRPVPDGFAGPFANLRAETPPPSLYRILQSAGPPV